MASDEFAAQPHTALAEIDLGLAARQMRLRYERPGIRATVRDADLGAPFGHVGPNHRVGHVGHLVLDAQPVEDAGHGMALLTRRIEVVDKDLVDDRFERIELGRPHGIRRPLCRPR